MAKSKSDKVMEKKGAQTARKAKATEDSKKSGIGAKAEAVHEEPAEEKAKPVTEKKKAKKTSEEAAKAPKPVEAPEEKAVERIIKTRKEKPVEKIKFFGVKRKLSQGLARVFKIAKVAKKKKPKFNRQELHRYKKLKDVWRTPRGIDSKLARDKRGKGARPKIGYKNPPAVSGLDPSGFMPVTINNVKELARVDKSVNAIVIAGSVGRKKRNDIIKAANEKKIIILNPRKGELPGQGAKRVLMVIAPKNFRDEELITPKEVFESAGFNVMIAGVSKTKAVGAGSTAVIPDVAIKDAKAEDYDAVVFIGGPGAKEHLWDNKDAQALAKGSAKAMALGSICLAGVVLARSGVLKGREATVFESEETIKEFESAGAKYVKKPVVVSGNIVTANGPEAAKAFGAKIVDILNK